MSRGRCDGWSMTRTERPIAERDPLRGKLQCYLREVEGRVVRYCHVPTYRIMEPGVEQS